MTFSPGTSTRIDISRLLLLLKASATRFKKPVLCLTTKVNFSRNANQRPCLAQKLCLASPSRPPTRKGLLVGLSQLVHYFTLHIAYHLAYDYLDITTIAKLTLLRSIGVIMRHLIVSMELYISLSLQLILLFHLIVVQLCYFPSKADGQLSRKVLQHEKLAVLRAKLHFRKEQLSKDKANLWDNSNNGYLDALKQLTNLKEEGKIKTVAVTNFDTQRLQIILENGIPIISNLVIKCNTHGCIFTSYSETWWDYSNNGYLDALKQLTDLKEEGKIKTVALTNFDTEWLQIILENGIPIISNLMFQSFWDQKKEISRGRYQNAHCCRCHGCKETKYARNGRDIAIAPKPILFTSYKFKILGALLR
ncbi:norsolorinic acid reductase B [Artemisia annua]|uniref:Norsolorinic acid reductase B n=1 Tax=Artemisia annua TaxID=35608 RepID=A0A2U1L2Z2_ARTAN|nr:norsolorinic acid reductase B [Artemisia annua]